MKPENPVLSARLVNSPFGDPGLYIHLRLEGRAFIFDLGQNESLPAADLLRVSHVFVSHCHMDHFIGFDRVLRAFLSREKTLWLFGPLGILDCVEGKLRGYTWNLVDGYAFGIDVTEVGRETMQRARFQAATGFQRERLPDRPFTGILLDEPACVVRTTHLDHRIDSLAFAIQEKPHLNVDTDVLAELGVPPGRWLAEVKQALRDEQPDDACITATWDKEGQSHTRTFLLGELRGHLVKESRGQKFAYVVDTLYCPDNAARIADLAHGADVFFCESPFLSSDEHQATKRYHLTAQQAGFLGRAAQAHELVVFHFSPRYAGQAEELYKEALETFRGECGDAL